MTAYLELAETLAYWGQGSNQVSYPARAEVDNVVSGALIRSIMNTFQCQFLIP